VVLSLLSVTDLLRPPISFTSRRRAAVAAGGAIGALLRGATGEIVAATRFDLLWATLLVNVTGSLFLGFLIARHTGQSRPSPLVVPFVGVGILGAFTTFSLFRIRTVQVSPDRQNIESMAMLPGKPATELATASGRARTA
jgi:protein CrcB